MTQSPSPLEALMNEFKEDSLLALMMGMLENIRDCSDDVRNDAYKLEKALRRLVVRFEKRMSDLPE